MTIKYQIFLISDSTGETLDRIFLALQSQFANFDYEKHTVTDLVKHFQKGKAGDIPHNIMPLHYSSQHAF